MSDLTTAQRLAAYRNELAEAGFDLVDAQRIVELAAPTRIHDIKINADARLLADAVSASRTTSTPFVTLPDAQQDRLVADLRTAMGWGPDA